MDILLPPMRFNNNGIMYVEWSAASTLYMDIAREIISCINCNAPWVDWAGYTHPIPNREWAAAIAKSASLRLSIPSRIRGIYTDRKDIDRVQDITLDYTHIHQVIAWVYDTYKFNLYYAGDTSVYNNILYTNRTENTPICPGCGSWLELTWKVWIDNKYNLFWMCPRYTRRCGEEMRRIWPHMAPQFIHRQIINHTYPERYTEYVQTYFHNWEYDNHPIPEGCNVGPFTEWHIDNQVFTTQKVPMKETRVVTRLTDEQLQVLKDTYPIEGPAGLMKKYPHLKTSWYSIQSKAHDLGVKFNRTKLTHRHGAGGWVIKE